ncbi:hypothetical protein [uncultured Gammaproteobacteria bacterium]|nr:hypothetical protein [uncultured Gammaproteobacteria bacterium]
MNSDLFRFFINGIIQNNHPALLYLGKVQLYLRFLFLCNN